MNTQKIRISIESRHGKPFTHQHIYDITQAVQKVLRKKYSSVLSYHSIVVHKPSWLWIYVLSTTTNPDILDRVFDTINNDLDHSLKSLGITRSIGATPL